VSACQCCSDSTTDKADVYDYSRAHCSHKNITFSDDHCLLALLQQSITQLGIIAQPSFALQNCKCLCGVGTCGRTKGCLIPPHQIEDSLTSRVADWDEDSHHDTSQYLEQSHFTMADVFVWPQPYCLAVVQFRNILKKTSSLNCPQH